MNTVNNLLITLEEILILYLIQINNCFSLYKNFAWKENDVFIVVFEGFPSCKLAHAPKNVSSQLSYQIKVRANLEIIRAHVKCL